MDGQNKLEEIVGFAENPEPRCPCVLLLDTSGSMKGEPIEALNEGLKVFKESVVTDLLASKRVEVAVVTFDSEINVIQDFVTVDVFQPVALTTKGYTHMGAGVNKALDMIQARKQQYKDNGIAYYRPWVLMITDGEPQGESTNMIEKAGVRIKEWESQKRVAFFPIGVEGANMELLENISVRAPVKLAGLNFKDMFQWLSTSMIQISHSKLDEQISLPPPGWAKI